MHRLTQGLLRVMAVLIVLAAIATLGYVAGHHGGTSAAAVEPTRSTSVAGVLLTYPRTWQPAEGARGIDGLEVADQVVVAPGGDAAGAGLVAGTLRGGEASPLPERFLASLHAPPSTEVVGLGETQAYRYSRMEAAGNVHMLTLYVIPSSEGTPTVVGCYATAARAGAMQTCEGVVGTLRLQGEAQSYILTPDPEYARQVSAALALVSAQRAALGRRLRAPISAATAKALAISLAARLSTAVADLSELQPPPVVSQAQTRLLQALARARDAYSSFATAAGNAHTAAVPAERAQVLRGEAAIERALRNFTLLGYRQT